MTLTLNGRIQTRIFLAVTVGVLWTAVIVPFLPRPPWVPDSTAYRIAFASLLVMTVYGMMWDHVYHALQQLRWDKDWPSVFLLLSGLNEAALVWFLDHFFSVIPDSAGVSSAYFAGFAIQFGTTWTAMWLFSQGPMRVVCVRWRFEGGQIVNLRRREPGLLPGGLPEMRAPEGNGTAVAKPPAPAVLTAAAAGLTVYPGSGRAEPNGTPAATSGDLVEGATCGHGHFGYPGRRFCMICGGPLLPLAGTLGPGRRPPVGILIFGDGTTHVLDHDLRLAQAGGTGELTAARSTDLPAASALAEIRLAGWQPIVSSEFHGIAIALPGGGHLHLAPGVPGPLMPGAELTVGRHWIRYESPYQPADADLARPALATRPTMIYRTLA
jgi:hypothetical protein